MAKTTASKPQKPRDNLCRPTGHQAKVCDTGRSGQNNFKRERGLIYREPFIDAESNGCIRGVGFSSQEPFRSTKSYPRADCGAEAEASLVGQPHHRMILFVDRA
jgi:hypothetical protein